MVQLAEASTIGVVGVRCFDESHMISIATTHRSVTTKRAWKMSHTNTRILGWWAINLRRFFGWSSDVWLFPLICLGPTLEDIKKWLRGTYCGPKVGGLRDTTQSKSPGHPAEKTTAKNNYILEDWVGMGEHGFWPTGLLFLSRNRTGNWPPPLGEDRTAGKFRWLQVIGVVSHLGCVQRCWNRTFFIMFKGQINANYNSPYS